MMCHSISFPSRPPQRPCDAQCPDVSGLLHFPYIAQYYRVPYLHATEQVPLQQSLGCPPDGWQSPKYGQVGEARRSFKPREGIQLDALYVDRPS